ncbi:MAG: MBL fold metallo-hydrolase [Clostridia bacterium]|nr:MBL fold metallo-hydrolase [Clostridia bacterium]
MKTLTRALAIFMLLAGIAVWTVPGLSRADEQSPDSAAQFIALNIGKADCMLLLWEDQAFLIDAGYEQTYAALKTMLSQYGVAHLNGVFLTHCHKDHYGGLLSLAQSGLPIDAWYAAEIYYDVKPGQHPAAVAAASRGTPVTWLKAGDVVSAGSTGSFTVLGPTSVNDANENNNSLVLRFSCPQGSILLTGDMKEDEEYDLLRANAFSPTDVLKVGHHGDNKATTLNMLRAVQPKAALILTSTQEEIDTPARSTLSRLSATGCAIYVSQEAHDAWQVTLRNGVPEVTDVYWHDVPLRAENISLKIDLKDDLLTIRNDGANPLQLKDCILYSSRGDDMLTLPDASVPAGGTFTVGSRSTKGSSDYQWSGKKIWHQKKYDMAILYDAFGRPLARTDNGMPE